MRTFTLIIIIFVMVLLFFEVTDWTPSVPTTKEITTEKTVIVETVNEQGEVVNISTTKQTTNQTRDNP